VVVSRQTRARGSWKLRNSGRQLRIVGIIGRGGEGVAINSSLRVGTKVEAKRVRKGAFHQPAAKTNAGNEWHGTMAVYAATECSEKGGVVGEAEGQAAPPNGYTVPVGANPTSEMWASF
jgi:hypothetical protein